MCGGATLLCILQTSSKVDGLVERQERKRKSGNPFCVLIVIVKSNDVYKTEALECKVN